jgi:hypothetical protein
MNRSSDLNWSLITKLVDCPSGIHCMVYIVSTSTVINGDHCSTLRAFPFGMMIEENLMFNLSMSGNSLDVALLNEFITQQD